MNRPFYLLFLQINPQKSYRGDSPAIFLRHFFCSDCLT